MITYMDRQSLHTESAPEKEEFMTMTQNTQPHARDKIENLQLQVLMNASPRMFSI